MMKKLTTDDVLIEMIADPTATYAPALREHDVLFNALEEYGYIKRSEMPLMRQYYILTPTGIEAALQAKQDAALDEITRLTPDGYDKEGEVKP